MKDHSTEGVNVMKDGTDPLDDDLGIIHALATHMRNGNSLDELIDERLFDGRKNTIVAKMEMVVDENFGGDTAAFHNRMLTVIATATFEGDDPVLAIESWLDVEWKASGQLYN
jgi:hypothetical protein